MTYQGAYQCGNSGGLGVVRIGGSGGGVRVVSGQIGNQSIARVFSNNGNWWQGRNYPYYPFQYPYYYAPIVVAPTCATPCAPLNIGGYGCYTTDGRLATCTPQAVVPIVY